jgi:hypothetical protein
MAKIRIIANNPKEKGCQNITKYVGQIFEVLAVEYNRVWINLNNQEVSLFIGEYEWI